MLRQQPNPSCPSPQAMPNLNTCPYPHADASYASYASYTESPEAFQEQLDDTAKFFEEKQKNIGYILGEGIRAFWDSTVIPLWQTLWGTPTPKEEMTFEYLSTNPPISPEEAPHGLLDFPPSYVYINPQFQYERFKDHEEYRVRDAYRHRPSCTPGYLPIINTRTNTVCTESGETIPLENFDSKTVSEQKLNEAKRADDFFTSNECRPGYLLHLRLQFEEKQPIAQVCMPTGQVLCLDNDHVRPCPEF